MDNGPPTRTTPSPSAAHRRLRDASSHPVPWQFLLAQAFERAVYLAVFGGIAVQAVRTAIADTGPAATGPGPSDLAGGTGTAVVLSALALAVLLKALLAVGPVSVSAATASWLVGSPLDRRGLLVGSFLRVVVASAVAGLLWPGVLFLLNGFGLQVTGAVVLVSGAAGVACAGLAVCLQAARRRVARIGQRALSALAGVSALVLFADLASDGRVLRIVQLDPVAEQGLAIASVAVPAVACLLVAAGVVALGRLTRSSLSSGRAVAVGLALSVTSFEFGLLGSIVSERRAIEVGQVRSRLGGRRSSVLGLVLTDLVRISRAPGKLLAVGCLLLVPALFAAGASGPALEFVPAVFTVAAFLVADRLAGTQRTVIRSAGVRRLLNATRRQLDLGLSVVPLVGTTLWCLAAQALAAGVSPAQVAVASIGSVLVVYRISTRPPLSFDDTAFFDVGVLGPTPLGVVKQLSRGPALLLGLVLVQTVLL